MLLLSAFCALIAVLLIALVGLWHRFAGAPDGLAQEKSLYAGFIEDVDRRVAAGDLDAEAAAEERAEAGRALLRASAAPSLNVSVIRPAWLMVAVVIVAGLTFGLYLYLGHPSLSDQPYKKRLAEWTHLAQSDPDSVPPQIMAPVLRQGEASHADDPQYWLFLGRIDMLAGDTYNGLKDYQRALSLTGPEKFDRWSELGEAMTLRAGTTTPAAKRVFDAALQHDPHDTRAHYYLGRQAVADGQYDAARAHFEAALADVPVGDVRREQLEAELKAVDPAEKAGDAAKARIAGMVAALAASLKADPDNADGWARLLRSYDVLGDKAGHDAAVKDMQAHFPADQAAAILAKSQAAVGAEDTGGAQ